MTSPLEFIKENHFAKCIIIHTDNKTAFFPDSGIKKEKKQYFSGIIAQLANCAPGSHLLLYTRKEYIYLYKKDKTIYICECTNDISVSQLKMEFNAFIEDTSNKQNRIPKIFSSFFNR